MQELIIKIKDMCNQAIKAERQDQYKEAVFRIYEECLKLHKGKEHTTPTSAEAHCGELLFPSHSSYYSGEF